MTVVTRFAPSPTGFLHIGGARTALFNWLYARHMGGKFLLRIEDTDQSRNNSAAVDAILTGLSWLGVAWDGDVTYQSNNAARHAEVALKLLADGKAYKCFATAEELDLMRKAQAAAKQPQRYDGRWRDRDPAEAPVGAPYVVRLKMPLDGTTTLNDMVKGDITVAHSTLDDIVLLRADGTPTFLLSGIVDDHDAGVTDIIRGDDHLTNTFKQIQIVLACGWDLPRFAHIPLILDKDGKKLSKRHGAADFNTYKEDGFLADAMRSYMMRLGWSKGGDDVLTTEKAIALFDVRDVGASPARLDPTKLDFVNNHFLRAMWHDDDRYLRTENRDLLMKALFDGPLGNAKIERLFDAIHLAVKGAKTILALRDEVKYSIADADTLELSEEAAALITAENAPLVHGLIDMVDHMPDPNWRDSKSLDAAVHALAETLGVKWPALNKILRAALSGRTKAPPTGDMLALLGTVESRNRLVRFLPEAAR